MPIDRKLFQHTFMEDHVPSWPCPYCQRGRLLLNNKTLVIEGMAAERRKPCKSPDTYEGRFSCLFCCSDSSCKEPIACCGGVFAGQHPNTGDWGDECEPVYFYPALPVFEIPKNCPNTVRNEIKSAFALHWSEPPGTANRIRCSLDRLMDHARIKRKDKNGNWINLHRRIEIYSEQKPDDDLVEIIKAAKWIGNAGSHSNNSLSKNDVFDGFDLLEQIVNKTFDQSSAFIHRLGRRINKRKGPVPKQK